MAGKIKIRRAEIRDAGAMAEIIAGNFDHAMPECVSIANGIAPRIFWNAS